MTSPNNVEAERAIIEAALAYEQAWTYFAHRHNHNTPAEDMRSIVLNKGQCHQILLGAVRDYRILDAFDDAVSPSGADVLALPVEEGNDADAATVGEYLIKLLGLVWLERDSFSGKRPFGSSGWASDLEAPLVRAGYVRGSFDEDGFLETVDSDQAHLLITKAIMALGANL